MEAAHELAIEITKLSGKVDALHNRFDRHEESTIEILKKHDAILIGNGTPGLKTDVATLKTWQESIKGKIKFWSGVAGTVVTVVIISYFGLK